LMVITATIAALCLALPLAILGSECWLALLPLRKNRISEASATAPLRLAVVIPAHNEEDCIGATVECVRQQIGQQDRVVVIADNCSDATAERARAAGAAVWERTDETHRGKGYTLNFAVDRLREAPPDIVVCIDADCTPEAGCIPTIARLAHQTRRPVQAAYLMHAPANAGGLAATSALAVFVKNVVRPRGLQRLGLPCLLNGSGMAFPWPVLASIPFPDEHIVEDARFSTDLAIAGFAPLPCMEVQIGSMLPAQHAGFVTQRTRWEHGHLVTILYEAPRLLAALVKRLSLRVLMILLELSVPPLTLLVVATIICLIALGSISYLLGTWLPILTYASVALIAATGLLAVWLQRGREILPPRLALQIPRYALVKVPMYLRFVTHRQRAWVRTERDHTSPGDSPVTP
jgi:cellulose synthase/poly-beta-1,6-N-acetylglucosamine synthase-like glycosyltransferase